MYLAVSMLTHVQHQDIAIEDRVPDWRLIPILVELQREGRKGRRRRKVDKTGREKKRRRRRRVERRRKTKRRSARQGLKLELWCCVGGAKNSTI